MADGDLPYVEGLGLKSIPFKQNRRISKDRLILMGAVLDALLTKVDSAD